jgi:hypothetical protein
MRSQMLWWGGENWILFDKKLKKIHPKEKKHQMPTPFVLLRYYKTQIKREICPYAIPSPPSENYYSLLKKWDESVRRLGNSILILWESSWSVNLKRKLIGAVFKRWIQTIKSSGSVSKTRWDDGITTSEFASSSDMTDIFGGKIFYLLIA